MSLQIFLKSNHIPVKKITASNQVLAKKNNQVHAIGHPPVVKLLLDCCGRHLRSPPRHGELTEAGGPCHLPMDRRGVHQ